MTRLLQTAALSALLLASASAAQAQISFGIHIGEPPAPRAYRVPPQPGPDYEWIEGYQFLQGGQYKWHDGYWSRPPYAGAYWVAPYYDNGQYFAGQWEGARGNVAHDHQWDRGDQRDDRRYNPSNGSYRDNGSMNARDQAQAMVRSAYRNVLGREPDPASAGWVDNVFTNRLSQQQLENELRNSAEYRQKHPGR
jgi:WXXGXW repeat (2 copies)